MKYTAQEQPMMHPQAAINGTRRSASTLTVVIFAMMTAGSAKFST
jgi:hypothetical protein